MKFLIISPKNRPTYNFRGDLLKEIQKAGYETVAVGPDLENADEIAALGVRLCVVPLNKNGTSVLGDWKYYKALKKLIREERPDITLGYTVKPSIFGALAAKKAGVGCVNSMITGLGYTFASQSLKARILRKIVSFLYKKALKKADNVFFQNSDDLKEFVEKGFVNREKCVVVNGSGVNMEKYAPEPYPEKLTFFMLARVMYAKGVIEYLKAATTVKTAHPEARFVLLGSVEGFQDSVPMEIVQSYIDIGAIEYFGETKDVRPFFAACSVFVLPSYREGTPRTVLEAMSMARPIITTNAPGCRNTIEEGVNGFLVPAGDSEALADAMLKFIKQPETVPTMGAESRRICAERFEVGKVNGVMMRTMGIERRVEDEYVTV